MAAREGSSYSCVKKKTTIPLSVRIRCGHSSKIIPLLNILPTGMFWVWSNKLRQVRRWGILLIVEDICPFSYIPNCRFFCTYKTFQVGMFFFFYFILQSSSENKKSMHTSQPDAAAAVILALKMESLRSNKVPSREWILRINFSHVWFFTSPSTHPLLCLFLPSGIISSWYFFQRDGAKDVNFTAQPITKKWRNQKCAVA